MQLKLFLSLQPVNNLRKKLEIVCYLLLFFFLPPLLRVMCATSHIWNAYAMSQRAYKSTNHPQEFTRHHCVSELFCPI